MSESELPNRQAPTSGSYPPVKIINTWRSIIGCRYGNKLNATSSTACTLRVSTKRLSSVQALFLVAIFIKTYAYITYRQLI